MTDAPDTILIVDDTPENLDILIGILKEDYRLKVATDGQSALELATATPPDLVLLDIMMPGMDGFEVCRRLKAEPRLGDVPVIFVSALGDLDSKVRAFTQGGVDYVTKPFQGEEVEARVKTQLRVRHLQMELEDYNRELENRVAAQVKEIAAGQFATIFALSKLAESRDDDTGQHLERVRTFCKLLADRLGQAKELLGQIAPGFVDTIYYASPLHDIGKVAIPDRILLKPGKLTKDEFETMKTHTTLGAKTLEAVAWEHPGNAFIEMGIQIARSHHERWDGNGYPDGLQGEQIPLPARIMAVADVYDALRSQRCYKPPFPHEKSSAIIISDSGSHFDPAVVEVFTELQEQLALTRESMNE